MGTHDHTESGGAGPRAGEPDPSAEQFGRVPALAIEAGALHGLTGGEVKVYLVFCCHADRNWQCWPASGRLQSLTGLAHGTVSDAVKGLVSKGRVMVTPGGGRGRSNTYTLVNRPGGWTVSTPKPSGDAPAKPSGPAAETVRADPANRPVDRTGTDRTDQEQQQQGAAAPLTPAAAAGGAPSSQKTPDPAIRDALAKLGIGEPKLSDLAKLPGMSVKLVNAQGDRAKAHGKGTGALILNLEAAAEVAGKAEAKAARWDALTPEQRNGLAAEVWKKHPNLVGRPASDPVVRACIMKLLDLRPLDPRPGGS